MTNNADDYQISLTEQEWKEKLTPEEYYILREKGTERPFTGQYDKLFQPGVYKCAGCGALLFTSESKYNSGCGWPAFSVPADGTAVEETPDTSHGMVRTEITCSKCGGHLGHVFNDGPAPTGLRYCINSASLDFEKKDEIIEKE
jgi:peptide-methionine (R)-S-oxide reductase